MMTGQGSASDSLFGVKGIHNTTCGSTTYVRSTPRAQIELTENNNDFHTDASLQCELPLRQGIWTHYIVYTNHPSWSTWSTVNHITKIQLDNASSVGVYVHVYTQTQTQVQHYDRFENSYKGSGGIYTKKAVFSTHCFQTICKTWDDLPAQDLLNYNLWQSECLNCNPS